MTPVGPATITDALLLLVFCDICSSSLSLSFESLDSILISNFYYYFQDGRPTRYYNHRYYKPYTVGCSTPVPHTCVFLSPCSVPWSSTPSPAPAKFPSPTQFSIPHPCQTPLVC